MTIKSIQFKYQIESEMNSTRDQQLMYGSSPLYPSETTKSNVDSETESNNKTVSRFPPIKTKADQTPNLKQNQKDHSPPVTFTKKISEEPVNSVMKRTNNNLRKRVDKKKSKFPQIKAEVLQKYKLYLEFLNMVNLTNNIKITVNEPTPPYVLYVGKGNNSGLIKNIFKTYRPWWTLEENNPDHANINMYWYQLRQNNILERFKENIKSQADFEGCGYYVEEGAEKIEIPQEKQINRRDSSRSAHKKAAQVRSQSVTQKQIKTVLKLTKRSSSKTKGISQQKINMTQGLSLIKKDVKQDLDEEEGKKKRVLANPKMWPIYTNYRRIFSQPELKQIKKLKVIQQDGKIYAKISRNKVKNIENRSSFIKMHNHVTHNWNLSNKKALFMNLKNYYEAQKINPFEYIPMTFHVTDSQDKQFKKFQQEYERRAEVIKQEEKKKKNQQFKSGFKPKKRNAWLVKPGENTNRGTGIEVIENIQEIKQLIQSDKVDKMGRPRTHIIQEYIMPFLYQKRKFDIRSYILITSINGYQKGYWYQDGYIRTASKQFTMKNLNNKFIHLTNDAVQKHHEDYGKFQPANKLSYADFQRYLDTVYNSGLENGQKLKFYQQAYPQMKKVAADIFRSVYTKVNPNKKDFTFEIFGLDYMIDENFKVWLIQANTNPCLELSSPLLGRIIPGMLENAFKLTIDPVFPPPPIEQLVTMTKKLMLPDNEVESNKFELIFDEVQEGKELKSILSTTPEVKIYQVEEQDEQEYDQNGNECKMERTE